MSTFSIGHATETNSRRPKMEPIPDDIFFDVETQLDFISNEIYYDAEDEKQLLDLPDDCLIDICRYLPLEDLTSLAVTCTRLHTVGRQTFPLAPGNKYVDVKQMLRTLGANAMEKIERFFQVFGDLLSEISLDLTDGENNSNANGDFSSFNEPIFNLVTKHCDEEALTAFRGHGITLRTPNEEKMLRLFGRLKTITLIDCPMAVDALSVSKHCQHLSLSADTFNDVSDLHFPQLEGFDIVGYNWPFVAAHNANCAKFLLRHSHLKALNMEICFGTEFDMDVFDELNDLETLSLFQMNKPLILSPWRNLTKLKALDIVSNGCDATKFLQESPAAESLAYLKLTEPILSDDFFRGLSRFKQLRALTFGDCPELTDERMLNLNLDELTELELTDPSELTTHGLVEIVSKFRKLTSLRLVGTDHEIDSIIYEQLVAICLEQSKKLAIFIMDMPTTTGFEYNPNYVQVFFKHAPRLEMI